MGPSAWRIGPTARLTLLTNIYYSTLFLFILLAQGPNYCLTIMGPENQLKSINLDSSFYCHSPNQCSWVGIQHWNWVTPSYDGIKFNGPLPAPDIQGMVLTANFSELGPATLNSPLLMTEHEQQFCFSFRYYFLVDRADDSTLTLNFVQNGSSPDFANKEIWISPGRDADRWYSAEVDIEQGGAFRLVFRASSDRGIVALTGFDLNKGLCQHAGECDFESGSCGWDWKNPSGDGSTNGYRFNLTKSKWTNGKIKLDHSSRSPNGHVINLPSAKSGSKARLKKETSYESISKQCFRFWYMPTGNGITLKLYTLQIKGFGSMSSELHSRVWQNEPDAHLQSQWILVQKTLDFNTFHHLYFDAENSDDLSSIELDDINLTPFDCPEPISCNFKENLCGWQHSMDQSDLLHWSEGIGRVFDSTALKFKFHGKYLRTDSMIYTDFTAIVDTSIPTRMEMVSEWVRAPNADGACFWLYYRVKNIDNGDQFRLETIDIEGNRTVIWKFNPKAKLLDLWHNLPIFVPNPAKKLDYRLSLIAESSHRSTYLMVQSFEYKNNVAKCGDRVIHQGTTTTVSPPPKLLAIDVKANNNTQVSISGKLDDSKSSLMVDDIGFQPDYCNDTVNCDFENDMCGWSNYGSEQILWLRHKLYFDNFRGKAMDYDRTSWSRWGHYLVLPMETHQKSIGTVKSPIMHQTSSTTTSYLCLRMHYFAQAASDQVYALRVDLVDLTRPDTWTTVFINASTTMDWKLFQHQFSAIPEIYSFRIQSISMSKVTTDIGLDDIKLKKGLCAGPGRRTSMVPSTSDTLLDCNFDQANCNWNYNSTEWSLTSGKEQEKGQTNYWAPRKDHTHKMLSGKYLLLTGENSKAMRISSSHNISYYKDHCLTFWYFEDGEGQFELESGVSHGNSSIRCTQFGSNIVNRRHWTPLKIDLNRYFLFVDPLKIESVSVWIQYKAKSVSDQSVFALDDIRVRPGWCGHQHDFTYTFTDGYNGLDKNFLAPAPLMIEIGSLCYPAVEFPQPGVPQVDHTTNTPDGVYFLFRNIFFERKFTFYSSSSSSSDKYIDTLTMYNLDADSTIVCVRFAYVAIGDVELKVFIKPNRQHHIDPNEPPVWTPRYSKSSWTVAEFNKQYTFSHQLVFWMAKEQDNSSLIALDDISVLSVKCQLPIDCDFQQYRFCSYGPFSDQTTTDDYAWSLYTYPTYDPNWPGPQLDHTSKSYGGGYLYLSGYRSSISTSSVTQLLSKVISGARDIKPETNYCLTFWSQFTQEDLHLLVHVVRYGESWADNNRTLQVVKFNADSGWIGEWSMLKVDLRDSNVLRSSGQIQIIFEGRIPNKPGTATKSVIAIDDIVLSEGSCDSWSNGIICENGKHVQFEQVCDFVKDCPSGLDELDCGNCNFETDSTCGWRTLDRKKLNFHQWEVESAKTTVTPNAPRMDGQGNSSGHYIMIHGTGSQMENLGLLALNYQNTRLSLKNAYKTCMMGFDYNIKSNRSNPFSLSIKISTTSGDENTIYRIIPENSYTGGWRRDVVSLAPRLSRFIMEFEAWISDPYGIIALDNIQFMECSPPKPLPAGQKCQLPGQVMCDQTRICIDQDEICDFWNDCTDGWDESSYFCAYYLSTLSSFRKNCDFEYGLEYCGIETEPTGLQQNANWVRKSGTQSSADRTDLFEPTVDDSSQSANGHFLVLEPLIRPRLINSPVVQWKSYFYSPMFSSITGQQCRMRFFHYFNAVPTELDQMKLEIFIHFAKKFDWEPTPILTIQAISSPLRQSWQKMVAVFPTGQNNDPFQFVVVGTFGRHPGSRMAIDDISYDNSSCVISHQSRITTTKSKTPESEPTCSPIITTTTTTTKPGPFHNLPGSILAGSIVVAIFVPVLVLLGLAGVWFGYRRYQLRYPARDDRLVVSMKAIQNSQT